mmetsp:Transcript_61322/g.168299  ORF Transcript_61322/g.168299 Transcript_61322/m.168299 type:complete len:280 (-) Transcript_61322:988-1827(-)
MEARGDRHAVRRHAVRLLGLAEVHATAARASEGARDLDVKPHVLEGLGGMLEEMLVRVRHLNEARPLAQRMDRIDVLARVLHRTPHTGHRVSELFGLELGEQQRNRAARVGARHGGAVHELPLVQGPVWHGRDGAARSHERHTALAVRRGPDAAPGVGETVGVLQRRRERRVLDHAVLGRHHRRQHHGRNADEGSGRAAGRSHGREGGAVVAGRCDEDDAVLVNHLVGQLLEAARVHNANRLAVAHVDEVRAMLDCLDEGAGEAHTTLHRPEARVTDLQ